MKKGFLITTVLAMALGVGVAVGAHQSQRAEKAEAVGTTVYCKVTQSWWNVNEQEQKAGVGVHYWGGVESTTWPGVRGTEVQTNIWRFFVPSDSAGLIFTRISATGDVSDWGAKTADLALPTDGKNLYTITSESAVWGDPGVTGEWGNLYTVATHVRGESGGEYVEEGGLPKNPTLAFGEQSFDGWFDDEECSEGHEVTAITQNTEVYAKITKTATKTYTLDKSRVSTVFESALLHAWDSHGNNGWPGVEIEDDTFTVPSDASFLINNGDGEQTEDVTLSAVANDELRILNEKDDSGHYKTLWKSDADEPEEDGYYIVGELNDWKFAGATKVPMLPAKDANNNIAILYGYSATQYKQFKVRSYFNGADDWHVNTNPAESDIGWGGDNFSPKETGLLDIFVYEDGEEIKFSVSAHAERHNVAITNLLFEGSFLNDTVARPATIATEGTQFNPGAYDVEGYHQEGYFTDEECLHEYTPTEITTDDVQLYCKYMKVGYYVISGEGFWSLDNAFSMDSPDNPNNKAEVAINVSEVGETYSFVYYDGQKHGHEGLGANYEFVENEEDHIKFTKVGSYAVYWSNNDNKLYVNAGLEAFYTNFLNSVGGACHANGVYAEGELQAVKDAWALQEAAYNALTTEEQNTIKAIGFDTESESQDQSVRMVKMYSYIVKKYGTAAFNDFIWNQNLAGEHPQVLAKVSNVESGTTAIIVIAVATVSAIACGMLFLFKKKEQK